MKNKSSRHKETNTFKFLPFSERIANIDIDIFHRVGHEYETQQDDTECLFYQAITKWDVLNLTEQYVAFRKEVDANNLVTLPQLMHNKDKIATTLLKYLSYKNPLCLQPLLELVVAFANDLRKEFYEFYQEFLNVIIELLNTKDAEQLEWAFTCLAYLFKFLWRPLTKDVGNVFSNLLPLLSDSKPAYINSFAAESFAFVVRKIKDRVAFLDLLLKTVRSNEDAISGCGKLLFEVINGIDGQFHSCAEVFLPFLFEALAERKYQNILYEVLVEIVSQISTNIHPHKTSLFWNTCISTAIKLSETKDFVTLELVLKLIIQTLQYRHGKLLQDSVLLVQTVLKLIRLPSVPDTTMTIFSDLCTLMLLLKNILLPQEYSSVLTRQIMEHEAVLLHFVNNVTAYSSFKALVLPTFLQYCIRRDLDNDSLSVLTQLVQRKAPSCLSGTSLETWVKYTLDFKSSTHNQLVASKLIADATFEDANTLISNYSRYMCALVCLPHLYQFDVSEAGRMLIKNIEMLCKMVHTDTSKLHLVMFILLGTIECAVHIIPVEDLVILADVVINTTLSLKLKTIHVASLRVLDIYLTALRNVQSIICMDVLKKLHSVLEINFNSSLHEVRLLTTHIYTLFEDLEYFTQISANDWKVFSLCYKVESITPQVSTYRDQLQLLENLGFEKQQMSMCKSTDFKEIPLRYLCGVLYMNFQLLWEPVLNIIVSHSHGMEINDFWKIFNIELCKVVDYIKDPIDFSNDQLGIEHEFLDVWFCQVYTLEFKPDYVNYRILLWKVMASFAEIAEAKTRDVSSLFLNFMEEEYLKSNSDVALTWNIKENSKEFDNDQTNEVDNNVKQENIIQKTETKPVEKLKAKDNVKTLQYHLTVLSKIRSPKSMYREPELYKIYFDLLSHKHHEIQKLALDCIMTYKFKYLVPYHEHLYNLINDKNFKDELATFRVDTESAIIDEHRENLIPIVLKIVYSKMSIKTGLRTGGKASGQLRRNLVLRFLAGCHENEMLEFIRMAFRIYVNYFDKDLDIMFQTITDNVDLEKFLPPKRLQSSLNLLTVVIEQFGRLMGNSLLSFLLNVLFVISSFIKGALDRIKCIHSGYLTMLRNARTSCLKICERFFKHFESYPWTSDQIDMVFKTIVWPYVDKLVIEGIHSPTPLLKLFVEWGSNPRYFSLLVKCHPNDCNQYALGHVIKLLAAKQAHGSVVNTIMEMCGKLLSLIPDKNEEHLKIPVNNLLLSVDLTNQTINYGSHILVPHISVLLEVIKRKLSSKTRNINQCDLLILSRVSELSCEPAISNQVLHLLIPVILKKCGTGEEIVLKYVVSLCNLLEKVENPEMFIKSISPLFANVKYTSSRKILNNTLELIGQKCPEFRDGAKVIADLNAFDIKWIDQPDFQRRSDAFKSIQNRIDTNTLDVKLGVIIINNCYYTINNENDLSLRENAAHCWRNVATALLTTYKNSSDDMDYILNEVVFSAIRKGFRSKKDDLRNECILLLGHLARECSSAHVVLSDLNKLTNCADPEVDFFENITHLQLHRTTRALIKFCQIYRKEENAPSIRMLTQFILPLASYYLCSERFSSKNSLVDAAIDAVALISRLVPWHQYEGILKFYLSKLQQKVEFQKQLVRITVAVLDAFHFDLSKGHVESAHTKNYVEEPVEASEKQVEIFKENDNNILDEMELDAIKDEIEEDEIKEEEKTLKAVDRVKVLCHSTASRVMQTIQKVLLPQLHKALAMMTQHEGSHKLNRKKTGFEREEEELLRVPISLAVVKLLQQLPTKILESNLPGVFMKLCTFLKSQLESVRRVARDTLQKIMVTLGPKYLTLLLEQMTPLLSRGFQVHVLVYTVYSVLLSLKEQYQPTDVDKVLQKVLDLCKVDIFGKLADEKEVEKIGRKASEARSTKSYDTLQILATYITDKCLMDIIYPIKTVLLTSQSFKTVHKAQDCLRHIALGLVENEFVDIESLLKFAYGTSSESIPILIPEKPKAQVDKIKANKPDCFIIPAAPVGRLGFRQNTVKSSASANAHIIIEFGLRLCHYILKRERVKDDKYKPFLDPFVVVFKNCLKSRHVKLSTLTLQCLTWIMRYDIPAMREHIEHLIEAIFAILHKYAAAGLSKGDNFELVAAAFKAVSVLVRDVKYHTIETAQLKTLLLYAEQDLYNSDKQATVFALLRAIISRKLVTDEVFSIMQKVAELSITSELAHVRLQARLVFYHFMMDYPLKNKGAKYIAFYVLQLNYELQSGRESAIEMIQSLITSLPMSSLVEHSGTFMITLGARLINDDVAECRKIVADCITSLFKRLERPERDPLFDIIILWFKDRNRIHKQLAAQLCGLLVMVEKASFETRLSTLMPVIFSQLGIGSDVNKPGRFVLQQKNTDEEDNTKSRVKDHHLFQLLQMLLKLSAQCPSFLKPSEDLQQLSEQIQTLLAYPHQWVRLAAAQFLGFVLSSLDINKLVDLISGREDSEGYLYHNSEETLKSLTLDLCAQLQPGSIDSELAEQVIKNLIFVARVLEKINNHEHVKLNLIWLCRRMRRIINMEVVEAPSSAILRTEVFKWIAGVATVLQLEQVTGVLHHLLAPLVREMLTTDEGNAPLRQLSKEISKILKKRVGIELYADVMSKSQQQLEIKRAGRKRLRNQLAITDPEIYAKKKIKGHEKKKEAKKRKFQQMKGKPRKSKIRKTVDILDTSEVV